MTTELYSLGKLTATDGEVVLTSGTSAGEPALDACIILNCPLPASSENLIHQAKTVIACDGGANHLRKELPNTPLDVIIGDMDSATEDTINFFTSKAAETGHTCVVIDLHEDQDSTDLQKALKHYLSNFINDTRNETKPTIAILGCAAGRIDHMMQNFNIGLRLMGEARLIFVSDQLAEVIPPGTTTLQINPKVEGRSCALIPFAATVRGTTKGLVWNLQPTAELELRWGGLISTSNRIRTDTDIVTFTLDNPILWVLERLT